MDSGLTKFPDRNIQPPNQRINKQQAATTSPENMTIGLLELDGPNRYQVVKTIAHGVPLEILDSLKVPGSLKLGGAGRAAIGNVGEAAS
ncbi:hypothetical protein L1887_30343 [Cichorium endivia]|nr:hypothetical protein L1887_30343 [Cichorium endivia]